MGDSAVTSIDTVGAGAGVSGVCVGVGGIGVGEGVGTSGVCVGVGGTRVGVGVRSSEVVLGVTTGVGDGDWTVVGDPAAVAISTGSAVG